MERKVEKDPSAHRKLTSPFPIPERDLRWYEVDSTLVNFVIKAEDEKNPTPIPQPEHKCRFKGCVSTTRETFTLAHLLKIYVCDPHLKEVKSVPGKYNAFMKKGLVSRFTRDLGRINIDKPRTRRGRQPIHPESPYWWYQYGPSYWDILNLERMLVFVSSKVTGGDLALRKEVQKFGRFKDILENSERAFS